MSRRFVLKRSSPGGSPSPTSVAHYKTYRIRDDSSKFQQTVYVFVNYPESGKAAFILSLLILLTIISSTVAFLLQTLVEYENWDGWGKIEYVCTGMFIFEYISRFYACSAVENTSRLQFFFEPLNLIDLIAILPFFMSLGLDSNDLQALRVVRVIRLFRLFRLFKLGKYTAGMQVMASALRKGLPAFVVMIFYVLIISIVFGALFYQFEKQNCPDVFSSTVVFEDYQNACETTGKYYSRDGRRCCVYVCPEDKQGFLCISPVEEEIAVYPPTGDQAVFATKFQSVIESSWLVIIGVLTIGLGDKVNTYWLSKIIGGVSLVFALITISLPMAILGSKFKEAYKEVRDQRNRWRIGRRSQAILEEVGGTLTGLVTARCVPLSERLEGLEHFSRQKSIGNVDPRLFKALAVFAEYLRVRDEIRTCLDTRLKVLHTIAELELKARGS
jgi:hypothetical protein